MYSELRYLGNVSTAATVPRDRQVRVPQHFMRKEDKRPDRQSRLFREHQPFPPNQGDLF